jgi:hypothetical protein
MLAHGFGVRTAIGVAIAYLPLFTALGTLPPILARAAVAGHGDPGRRAGLVSAAGTVGALVGVLVAGPGLVPVLRIEGAAAGLAALLALLATRLAVRRVLPAVVAVAAPRSRRSRPTSRRCAPRNSRSAMRPDADGAWVADGPTAALIEARSGGRRVPPRRRADEARRADPASTTSATRRGSGREVRDDVRRRGAAPARRPRVAARVPRRRHLHGAARCCAGGPRRRCTWPRSTRS